MSYVAEFGSSLTNDTRAYVQRSAEKIRRSRPAAFQGRRLPLPFGRIYFVVLWS